MVEGSDPGVLTASAAPGRVSRFTSQFTVNPPLRVAPSTMIPRGKAIDVTAEVMAAALLDRLLHRCHIVNIRGNSYRMRRHSELSKAIHPLGNPIDSGSTAATEALS